MLEQPTFIITTTDDENVEETIIVQEGQDYQDIFTSICEAHGVSPTEDTFNEGAMHLEDGTSIWIAMVPIQL